MGATIAQSERTWLKNKIWELFNLLEMPGHFSQTDCFSMAQHENVSSMAVLQHLWETSVTYSLRLVPEAFQEKGLPTTKKWKNIDLKWWSALNSTVCSDHNDHHIFWCNLQLHTWTRGRTHKASLPERVAPSDTFLRKFLELRVLNAPLNLWLDPDEDKSYSQNILTPSRHFLNRGENSRMERQALTQTMTALWQLNTIYIRY